MEEPEPPVVRAAMQGDTAAFESLVRAYEAPVWRFLTQLLGDSTLAEDVAQETFLRCYTRLPGFRFRAKFSTWLFQIARNAGVDALRSRARRDRLVQVVPPPPPATMPERRAEIRAALDSLSIKLREAVLVVEVLGLTYREASTVLDVPEGTVKSRVFQARERLASWLDAEEEVHEV